MHNASKSLDNQKCFYPNTQEDELCKKKLKVLIRLFGKTNSKTWKPIRNSNFRLHQYGSYNEKTKKKNSSALKAITWRQKVLIVIKIRLSVVSLFVR